ncbi:hypothetical protein A3K29_01630 [Candidatus Collierbacteria bacterium RIFOXYB2_FULL_46_14]|uniref:Uncharacterized protein n=1 Tax=Candidatus Collierbacteria bacterium GW2011_GWA2_46_26 TaxID=1618381 RepID=A0A0G1PJC7_9BACT|nr:MAG: hypothetical protein UW29_C0006G0065 [Candidatus Collierbacteria bacterium GW2011_GWC2_44_13]KKU32851.1 MAG: hypothetical protein UX47_C0007G0095 [Candidatus Collierbacteria bacterium GW2011_GWA2_46_26]OGD72831.1 MAG: hypothetical protein A3K29_01630 [Candidatus Collierbacteria bacterium RIFOXYB2_FULL_46_14]OGD75873.1 MAG: hypothetical protein A3K43_01630 [Candidatus Collierbacteria bacterium RIFOXYA2_FULL_46_20]OGD77209.1 MAG: hypothetical protein A3K39_01630 [Candidatus Collierbacteri
MTIFQTVIPPYIDPQTRLELWSVTIFEFDGKYYANRTLRQVSTWEADGKSVLKAVDVPAKVYGPGDPMILISFRMGKQAGVLLRTRTEFEALTKDFPIRTQQEEAEWREQVLNLAKLSFLKTEHRILELKVSLAQTQIDLCQALVSALREPQPKN